MLIPIFYQLLDFIGFLSFILCCGLLDSVEDLVSRETARVLRRWEVKY